MALVQMNFNSEYLKGNHEISIILPDRPWETSSKEFYASGKKYPVLWLLHGTFGDHTDWLRKTNIELYACEKNLIVVMPSGQNSNYLNWPGFACGFDMWDYLQKELMPLVYNWFPASSKREDNYLCGLSMGGRGALQYAAAMPESFSALAVLSSCACDPRLPNSAGPDVKRYENLVNSAGGLEAYLKSPANVWDKLPELAKSGRLPRLYFASGKDDFLFEQYLTFKQYAASIGLEAVFEEFDGYGHEWRFWDMSLQQALEFFDITQEKGGNPY